MKFLGALSRFVLCTATAVTPFAAGRADDPPNPTHAAVQAKRTPVLFQLDLMVYSSAKGHGLRLGDYLASFRLPGGESEDECETRGKDALESFRGGVLPDGSRLLPMYSCEEE